MRIPYWSPYLHLVQRPEAHSQAITQLEAEQKVEVDLARDGATFDAEKLALEVARFRKPCSRLFGHSFRRTQIATLDRAWEAQVATLHTARAHQCLRHARPDQRGPFFEPQNLPTFWDQ
jgi:hypothetical protein